MAEPAPICDQCRKYTRTQRRFMGLIMTAMMALGPGGVVEIAIHHGFSPSIHTVKREKKLDRTAVMGSDWWL
jgi:hypothetical protein